MVNREFLMLAQNYDDQPLVNKYLSEKLDGVRCFWDGGITRGKENPCFMNVGRDKRVFKVTGLWSRYARPFFAPDWFVDRLPVGVPMDGELYLGRGKFQETVSIVTSEKEDKGWDRIKFKVFGMPGYADVFGDGRINNQNFKKVFNNVCGQLGIVPTESKVFDWVVNVLQSRYPEFYHEQTRLPFNRSEALALIEERLDEVDKGGGEGLMLQAGGSRWTPRRVPTLLKIKSFLEADAVVVGHNPGEGKYTGMLGSLRVAVEGVVMDVSGGLDDRERFDRYWPIGTRVRLKYKSKTNDGVLREARLWK